MDEKNYAVTDVDNNGEVVDLFGVLWAALLYSWAAK